MDSLYTLFQVLHHDPDSLEAVFKSALETQGEKSYEIGHVLYAGLGSWVCCILARGPAPETALWSRSFQANSSLSLILCQVLLSPRS